MVNIISLLGLVYVVICSTYRLKEVDLDSEGGSLYALIELMLGIIIDFVRFVSLACLFMMLTCLFKYR